MKKKTKKRLVRVLTVIAVLIGMMLIFRTPIYNGAVKYRDAGARKSYKVTNRQLAEYIDKNLPDEKFSDIHIIIDISQRLASESLRFSLKAKESDPNKTFVTGEANCVGYAAFAAAVANYIIEKVYRDGSWVAMPRKGKLYLLGIDIHKNIESRWFKDHDFVIYRNRDGDVEIYADPSVNDYMCISRVGKYNKGK